MSDMQLGAKTDSELQKKDFPHIRKATVQLLFQTLAANRIPLHKTNAKCCKKSIR